MDPGTFALEVIAVSLSIANLTVPAAVISSVTKYQVLAAAVIVEFVLVHENEAQVVRRHFVDALES